MLVIIASAKTQHYSPLPGLPTTQPALLEKAAALVRHCRSLGESDLQTLMKISDKLAHSTIQRFKDFTSPHDLETASPALTTFAGDVFAEIQCAAYSADDFLFANERLRILSGLYGILRPLDLMMPYRLEMGYKITPAANSSLYDYWGEAVTRQINRDLRQSGSSVVLNCASREYSRTVLTTQLNAEMLTLTFKQQKEGKLRSIAVYGKRARGMFVDWFIKNRIDQREQLQDFDRGGYRYAEDLSSAEELVFTAAV